MKLSIAVESKIISAIVPVYQNQDVLDKCLEGILQARQAYRDIELIVVDDGSPSHEISRAAKVYADQSIRHAVNLGRSAARSSGAKIARGELLVFIDSDVVVPKDAFRKIRLFFETHPEIDALCGLLSKEHPNPDFFSQYKNLYMHYIFRQLPVLINFLYGSIHAVRRRAFSGDYGNDAAIADDTALGQRLVSEGRKIALLKDLEVVHLKRHTLISLIQNDFRIPFDWAKIFIRYQGWRQLGKNKGGYLHAPKEQLVSVALVPIILLSMALSFNIPVAIGILLWLLLNIRFFSFLNKERGDSFAVRSILFTFLDHAVMALGILSGFIMYFFEWLRRLLCHPKCFSAP